jgi:hypothetical protein
MYASSSLSLGRTIQRAYPVQPIGSIRQRIYVRATPEAC